MREGANTDSPSRNAASMSGIAMALMLLGLAVVSAVPAQASESGIAMVLLQSGARVRYKTPVVVKHFYGEREEGSAWISGTLVEMDHDFIRVSPEGDAGTVTVPRDSVIRMERSLGVKAHTKTGMLLGGLVGAAIGWGIAEATDAQGSCSGGFPFGSCSSGEEQYAGTGFVLGAATGFLLAHIFKFEKWERVPGWDRTLSMRLRIMPARESVALGVAVGF